MEYRMKDENNHEDLQRILMEGVDPARCSYEEWLQAGMALHESGLPCSVWEAWSRQDAARYHEGECASKWAGFGRNTTNPVKSGTIVALARAQGYVPEGGGHELDWDDVIGERAENDDLVVIDRKWLQSEEVPRPERFEPARELIHYLETLFSSEEYVGINTECWQKDDGRYLPTKGSYDRTAGQLIQALYTCGGDIGSVIGDWKKEAGAWIRFNPLDGKGVRDENVTSYRYALVESDDLPIGMQYAILQKLQLPIAVLVHSGGKSLHAIVRIDAMNYEEYRKRVDYLYDVCAKNGLKPDKQNRNPSRLSRMPGVTRDGREQYIVARGIGQESFEAWKEYIESVNDNLPDEENLADVIGNLPPLAPPLIAGVLRQGHKMLLAGPSKAGKSFALIELCIAIAEGQPWLGFPCAQGRVMYVNLELDRASCLHRFEDVYRALGVTDRHPENITVWNLRGKSAPMDKLAPKLIRRASKQTYAAIVIDPIYKIITGDENSADQMAAFCNQFDKVATELGCAVIYCHHHSKGAQGQKASRDRASGSGVFARDPDALLDMIQLPVKKELLVQQKNETQANICMQWLRRFRTDWASLASQDDACSAVRMMEICRDTLPERTVALMASQIHQEHLKIESRTAWRIEATLREFPGFAPRNLWFDYPVHRADAQGVLADVQPEGEAPAWGGNGMRKKSPQQRKDERKNGLQTAYDACRVDGGNVTVSKLAEYMGVSEKTVRRHVQESGTLELDDGAVVPYRRGEKE